MDVIGILIFWGFIWVTLTWRCFAVTSICREVSEGKTTKDALSFQLLQVGIFFLVAVTILRTGTKDILQIITATSLLFTGVWYIYSISKAELQLKKNKQNQSTDPTSDNARRVRQTLISESGHG